MHTGGIREGHRGPPLVLNWTCCVLSLKVIVFKVEKAEELKESGVLLMLSF